MCTIVRVVNIPCVFMRPDLDKMARGVSRLWDNKTAPTTTTNTLSQERVMRPVLNGGGGGVGGGWGG